MAVDTREVGVLSAHWLLSSERFRMVGRGIGSVIQQGCVDPSDLRSPSKHRIYVWLIGVASDVRATWNGTACI